MKNLIELKKEVNEVLASYATAKGYKLQKTTPKASTYFQVVDFTKAWGETILEVRVSDHGECESGFGNFSEATVYNGKNNKFNICTIGGDTVESLKEWLAK